MEIKKIEVEARLMITIQSSKQITPLVEQKAILLTEVSINNHSCFCFLDEGGTKALYRCHLEE